MLEDLDKTPPIADENRDREMVNRLIKEKNIKGVTYDDWKVLDLYELTRGNELGRPRLKVTTVAEMMDVIEKSADKPA
jgi:hypothetical protein